MPKDKNFTDTMKLAHCIILNFHLHLEIFTVEEPLSGEKSEPHLGNDSSDDGNSIKIYQMMEKE